MKKEIKNRSKAFTIVIYGITTVSTVVTALYPILRILNNNWEESYIPLIRFGFSAVLFCFPFILGLSIYYYFYTKRLQAYKYLRVIPMILCFVIVGFAVFYIISLMAYSFFSLISGG